jgi:hypothetical protein
LQLDSASDGVGVGVGLDTNRDDGSLVPGVSEVGASKRDISSVALVAVKQVNPTVLTKVASKEESPRIFFDSIDECMSHILVRHRQHASISNVRFLQLYKCVRRFPAGDIQQARDHFVGLQKWFHKNNVVTIYFILRLILHKCNGVILGLLLLLFHRKVSRFCNVCVYVYVICSPPSCCNKEKKKKHAVCWWSVF